MSQRPAPPGGPFQQRTPATIRMTTTAVFPFDVAARDCIRSYHLSDAGTGRTASNRLALVIPKGIGVGAPLLPATTLAIVPLRCRAPGIPRPILVGVGALVARGGGGVAFGSSGAVGPVALGIGAFRATPADTGASMILPLGSTRKHVAAARSNGNLTASVACAIVRPTKPGVPDLPLGLPFDDACKKRSGAVAPWNYYSRVPLFPRSLQEEAMNGLIYLIGLIVVILAILSFFGLR